MAGASAGALVMTLTTPAGKPASSNTAPIRLCRAGQISEALSTTVLPQASGMAIARVPRMSGAFHGAIPSTTPHGCRRPIARLPGTSDGMTSPPTCVVMAAASRSMPAASAALKPYQPGTPPASATPRAMKSSARRSITSAALSSRRRRSPGSIAAHAGNAACAACTAASASARDAAAAREATSPVAGLGRSQVAPPAAARCLPPMSNWLSNMAVSFVVIGARVPAGRPRPRSIRFFFLFLCEDGTAQARL